MKTAAQPALDNTQTIHMLPQWVTSARDQDTDSVAFTSGAALAMLDVVLRDPSGTLPGACYVIAWRCCLPQAGRPQ